MPENPYNELSDDIFLIYIAQNDYMIDGHYLPEGVRLNAVADAIKRTEALLREQTQKAIEAAFALREAKRERDEARREVCAWQSGDNGKKFQDTAKIRGWDCFETKEREEAMDRLAQLWQLDEELGL
jgi:putative NIF3 family GTP cyclohydrolase 1 type 2